MKHDAQGFLLGDRISTPSMNASPALAVLGTIRRDVSVMRRLLESKVGRIGARRPARAATERVAIVQPGTVNATARRSGARLAIARTAVGGAVAAPVMRDARGRFVRATAAVGGGAATAPGVVMPAGPSGLSRATPADRKAAVESERDARGRFAGGGGSSDHAGENIMSKIAGSLDSISDAVNGAENLDPTIMALKEVRDAVSPVGRGFMALHNRMAERKKDRWYSRILKAITGRKGEAGGGGGGGDVGRGSFLGTFFGETVGKLAGRLPALLMTVFTRILAPVAAIWAGWQIGQWIGGKIYEWLDKSGVATKVFDAFDSVGKWFKEKFGAFSKGFNEQAPGASPKKLEPATSIPQRVGRFAGAVGSLFDRSKKTGSEYSAGNIDGLNDAQTRALVASTVMTESMGGKTDVVNKAGYMGRYQAGAGWLADAGLIRGGSNAVREAMSKDGFKNEYKWGESGGMTRFLKSSKNWNHGLSYDAYLASPETQDLAFKDNSSAAYRQLMASGAINKSTPSNVVAGALKARHLAGMGGAKSVLSGRAGAVDANGTSAMKYFQDVASDKHGFGAAFSSGIPVVKPATVPMSVLDKPAVTQAAPVPESLSRSQRNQTVVISKEDVGQDLRNRKAANIATGGIGG